MQQIQQNRSHRTIGFETDRFLSLKSLQSSCTLTNKWLVKVQFLIILIRMYWSFVLILNLTIFIKIKLNFRLKTLKHIKHDTQIPEFQPCLELTSNKNHSQGKLVWMYCYSYLSWKVLEGGQGFQSGRSITNKISGRQGICIFEGSGRTYLKSKHY